MPLKKKKKKKSAGRRGKIQGLPTPKAASRPRQNRRQGQGQHGVTTPCTSCLLSYKVPKSETCFSSRRPRDTDQRVKAKTSGQVYCCDLCPYSTKTLPHYRRHQLVHSREKPFKCTVCPKRFARSDTLNFHKRLHSGEKPYRCTMCPYRAASNSGLANHRKQHINGKNSVAALDNIYKKFL